MARASLASSSAIATLSLLLFAATSGCSTNDNGGTFGVGDGDSSTDTASPGSGGSGSSGGVSLGASGSATGGASAVATTASVWPPAQCATAPVESAIGAFCLGPEVAAADTAEVSNDNANSAAGCGTTLWGVVRDFVTYREDLTFTSPDFGSYCCNIQQGMVLPDLGADGKPVFSGVGATSDPLLMTSEVDFNQWYNDVEDVNIPYYVAFRLDDNGSGVFSFSAADTTYQYFPLDGTGWGNDENTSHNFSFTTEIHTQFLYQGTEMFSFTGDDDLWVFINKKLAIDIGGVHSAATDSINLADRAGDLGLEVGKVYSMDLFGAERHAGASNFHIETSMSFVDCGAQPPILL